MGELIRRVRALERRRDRERALLVREEPRWLDPAFRESVREAELGMFRDALTIAQVRRATEALFALVAEAAESVGAVEATKMLVDALQTIADGASRPALGGTERRGDETGGDPSRGG